MWTIVTLSDHTKLVNLLISLAHKTPDLKSPLNDVGYTLDHIGLKVVFSDGKELNPDISFKSHKANRLLLSEAKSGGVDNEQAKKYKALAPDDISRRGLTTLPAVGLSVETCYFCTSANRASVLANEAKHQWGFPIITFDGTSLKKERTNAKFRDEALEALFTEGITFDHEPTYAFYPFGEGDSEGWIVESVLWKLAVLATQGKTKFTEDQLVNECHPLIGYFGREEKKYVRRITHSALDLINKSGSQRFSIKPLKGQEWQIVKFSLGKFTKRYITFLADSFDKKGKFEDLTKWFAEEEKKEPED